MLIWNYWPGLEGGSERQCRKMARLLVSRGIECEVLTARLSFASARTETDGGVRIVRFGALGPLVERIGRGVRWLVGQILREDNSERILRLQQAVVFWLMLPCVWLARLAFMAEVRRHLAADDRKPHVLHLHEPSWLGGFAVWLARDRRVTVLCQEASFPVLQPLSYDTPFRSLWQRLRRDAYYIAMAPYVREALGAAGIPSERIFDLPNGVTIPSAKASGSEGGTVLYVGNFSQGAHWKAFDVLIQAWADVHRQRPTARLVLVGGGNRAPWEHLAQRLLCRDSMTFAGRVTSPEDYYRKADVFVLPSRVEGMSNALLEAQSWGLPCVVSGIPGNTAVVSDGQNGFVVPPGSVQPLAEAVLQLLADSVLRSRLGAAARHRAETEFADERVVSRLIDIYCAAVSRGSPSP